MHNDREGYARTCKAWLDGLSAHREAAMRLVGEDVFQSYNRYLSYSYIGFKRGKLDLYRVTLRRVEPERNAGS